MGQRNSILLHCGRPSLSRESVRDFNDGALQANGQNIVFIDVVCTFVAPEPLKQLSALCPLDDPGVSEPKLVYRDDVTKYFSVAVTSERIIPRHRDYPDDFPAYQCNVQAFQDVSVCSVAGFG